MGIEKEGSSKAKPEEMLSDENRRQLAVPQQELSQEQSRIETTERSQQIEVLRNRTAEIIQSAIERQKILAQRLENYYQRKAINKMDADKTEMGTLGAMSDMGIEVDQDTRDISIRGLDTALEKINLYFTSDISIGVEELQGKMDALESYLNNRLSASEDFVEAIESGEDRIQARFKYLREVDDFGTIWQKVSQA